nr:FAD-binding protein [Pseudobdellovibrionaceae bacterium]
PMRIFPAPHYTMGGLWVDYNLMSTLPGLFVAGEANFSDHGANRLGASALMQGLADGYFVLPFTIGNYIASEKLVPVTENHDALKDAKNKAEEDLQKMMNIKGARTVESIHKELGRIMWDYCGMARNAEGLKKALELIPKLKDEFWNNVRVPGELKGINPELEKAGRVADFLELGELMCLDALDREESCGGHFREEHQTPEGEALRNDDKFCNATAWEFNGDRKNPNKHIEDLKFENIKLATRSYK